MKLSNLFGFLPVSQWKFKKTIIAVEDVLNALMVAEAQHTNIEQGLLEKVMEKQQMNTQESKKEESHVEFG